MANLSLIITPPVSTRASKSKVDKDVLSSMAEGISSETWVFDGKTYKTAKAANSAAGPYRRALPKELNVPAHTLISKVWGEDSKGAIITDRTKQGTWRFAFSLDPERKPKQSKKDAAATAVQQDATPPAES